MARRRSRVYVRGHVGCLGCSIPLLVLAGVVALAIGVLW
jgi:hypothetical protein